MFTVFAALWLGLFVGQEVGLRVKETPPQVQHVQTHRYKIGDLK